MKRPLPGVMVLLFLSLTLAVTGCGGSGDGSARESAYSAAEVAAAVDAWPSGWPGAGEVSTAIINVCQAANTGEQAVEIHPFEASPLEAGRWKVTTSCDYSDAESNEASFAFEWVFFEDGPRLEPSGGRAADVTGP